MPLSDCGRFETKAVGLFAQKLHFNYICNSQKLTLGDWEQGAFEIEALPFGVSFVEMERKICRCAARGMQEK